MNPGPRSADTSPRPRLETSSGTLRRLERCALAALPARSRWELPGWLCLADDGSFVGRANSATPLPCAEPHSEPCPEPVDVAEVVAGYAARGLRPLVRWTPEATAANAARLSGPDWRRWGEVLVMTRPTRHEVADEDAIEGVTEPATEPRLDLHTQASASWSATYASPYEPREGAARLRLAADAPPPRRYAELDIDGRTAGVGLGVVHEGVVGVFDVLTLPERRRQGVAGRIVAALLAWGAGEGADAAFLQVAAGNLSAINLYEKFGFATAYSYVYASPVAASDRRASAAPTSISP